MLQVEVELLGLARKAAGQKQVVLELPEQSTYRDVIHSLAEKCPSLVGQVIDPQTKELFPSFMLNLDGRQVIKDSTQMLSGSEHLILMFVEAGG